MSDPAAAISVPVDLQNPGQFFACCGLLELAARIDVGALGWFRDRRFNLSGQTGGVLDCLFECAVEVSLAETADGDGGDDPDQEVPLDPYRGRVPPVRLRAPFNLLLDWWRDEQAQDQKLKTWTAGQRVTDLFIGYHKGRGYVPSMREHFACAARQWPLDWLRASLPIKAPSSFGFDSRLSRNNALDLGHTEGGTFQFSPAVEVLALIGFQRFRPLMVTQWSRNRYCTWREPLPVAVAAVAALGCIPTLVDCSFEFPVIRRDSQGRFKLFGQAEPVRR